MEEQTESPVAVSDIFPLLRFLHDRLTVVSRMLCNETLLYADRVESEAIIKDIIDPATEYVEGAMAGLAKAYSDAAEFFADILGQEAEEPESVYDSIDVIAEARKMSVATNKVLNDLEEAEAAEKTPAGA